MGQDVAGFAPVEARVGDKNLDAGEEQGEEGEGRNPVSDADEAGVAGAGRGGSGDGAGNRSGHGGIVAVASRSGGSALHWVVGSRLPPVLAAIRTNRV